MQPFKRRPIKTRSQAAHSCQRYEQTMIDDFFSLAIRVLTGVNAHWKRNHLVRYNFAL